jgi:hypothetical protein
MREILLALALITIFGGCQSNNKNEEVLSHSEWFDVLGQAFLFSDIKEDSVYLYSEYDNTELKEALSYLYYHICDVYDFQTNDSINEFIKNRGNMEISSRLDTLNELRIEFISDTSGFENNYIVISEPFYFTNNHLCFSLSSKKYEKDEMKHWIYFLRKEANNGIKLFAVYDYQSDFLYKEEELSEY